MTKREICERILEILVRRGGYEDHLDIYKDLRDLILDLAAPVEEEPEEDEEKHLKDPWERIIEALDGQAEEVRRIANGEAR